MPTMTAILLSDDCGTIAVCLMSLDHLVQISHRCSHQACPQISLTRSNSYSKHTDFWRQVSLQTIFFSYLKGSLSAIKRSSFLRHDSSLSRVQLPVATTGRSCSGGVL